MRVTHDRRRHDRRHRCRCRCRCGCRCRCLPLQQISTGDHGAWCMVCLCCQAKLRKTLLRRVSFEAQLFTTSSSGNADALSSLLRSRPEGASTQLTCLPVKRLGIGAGMAAGQSASASAAAAAWVNVIHAAALSGSVSTVATVLRFAGQGACTWRDSAGNTPLHYACAGAHYEVALLLRRAFAAHMRGSAGDGTDTSDTTTTPAASLADGEGDIKVGVCARVCTCAHE